MSSADNSRVDQGFLANAMASFLQISALVVLLLWCFDIVRPFIGIVVWALIIAVALHPLHGSLTAKLGRPREAFRSHIYPVRTGPHPDPDHPVGRIELRGPEGAGYGAPGWHARHSAAE